MILLKRSAGILPARGRAGGEGANGRERGGANGGKRGSIQHRSREGQEESCCGVHFAMWGSSGEVGMWDEGFGLGAWIGLWCSYGVCVWAEVNIA
jgi:hypothetical protein